MAFKVGSIYAEAVLDTKKWVKGASDMDKSIKGLSASTIAMSAAIAAVGAAMVSSTVVAHKWKKSFGNVRTIIDESVVGTDKMKKELLGLDSQLGKTRELTEGLYQALSASVEPVEAVEFVGKAAKFAKAALTDTFTSVDVLTTALNAYGLEATDVTRISDVFFNTIKKGKITGQQLASTIGTVIPTAAKMGVEVEQLGAALAVFTKQGISANEATTQIQAIFTAFLKPSEALTDQFARFGIESGSALIEAEGLGGAIEFLQIATEGNNEALAEMLPNVRAFKGVLALSGEQAIEYNNILDSMETATGATDEALGKQELTLETLGNTINKIQIRIGQVFLPTVLRLATGLNTLLENETDLEKSTRELDTATEEIISSYNEYANVTKILEENKESLTEAERAELVARQALARVDTINQILELNSAYNKLFDSQGQLLPEMQENADLLDATNQKIRIYAEALRSAEVQGLRFAQIMGDDIAGGFGMTTIAVEDLAEELQDQLEMAGQIEKDFTLMEKGVSNSITGIATTLARSDDKLVQAALEVFGKPLRDRIQIEMNLLKETVVSGAEDTFTDIADVAMPPAFRKVSGRFSIETHKLTNTWEDTLQDMSDKTQFIGGQIAGAIDDIFGVVIDAKTNELEEMESLQEEEMTRLEEEKETRLMNLEDEQMRELELLQVQRDNNILSEEEFEAKRVGIEQAAANNKFRIESELDKKIEEKERKQREKRNAKKKEIFEAEKANQIANIWIQYALGLVGLWSQSISQLGPIAGSILAGVMTGVLTGIAVSQTVLIGNQQYLPEKALGGKVGGGNPIIMNEGGRGELAVLPDGAVIVPHDLSTSIARGVAGNTGRNVNISMAGAFKGANISSNMALDRLTTRVMTNMNKRLIKEGV